MRAYYNEIDPYCCQWLRNLIDAGLIPAGDVDERPIEEVSADDIRHYTQCHFFAGIAGWAYAARLAGWPDDRPLWTGSCPCQPFSNAGKRLAYDDPRNLWPHFARLIADCRPPAVAGEQVASKAGRLWLAGVRADLEALGYGVGAADLCAAGVGAPHIRARLWWVADAERGAAERHGHEVAGAQSPNQGGEEERQWIRDNARDGGTTGRLGHPQQQGLEGHAGHGDHGHEPGRQPEDEAGSTAEAGGHSWDGIWIPCADGKARRIEPGIEPLVDGFPFKMGSGSPLQGKHRVSMVRAYGNAIVPQVAAEFLSAYMETDTGLDGL